MPRILGTGLVALDLIVEHYESHQKLLVGGGGTCGNVLAILARAGWQSHLIGALDHSVWSEIMLSDLELAGVRTEAFVREPGARPSLIVEHLKRSGDSAGHHWFSLVCPRCHNDWPGLHAAPDTAIRKGSLAVAGQDVIFVDRLSEGVMELASYAKRDGALIVYEPSSKQDRPWVRDMLGLADIVKYSCERADALGVDSEEIKASLLVVTDGKRGTRWRLGGHADVWHHQPAHPAPHIVDTCGAGDWFTAGLLLMLFGETARQQPPRLVSSVVAQAMNAASALAAWSCGFVGARGALYEASSAELARKVRLGGEQLLPKEALRRPVLPEAGCEELASICG